MNILRPTVEAAYWLVLTVWTGAIVTAGVAASFAFTILPDVAMTLPDYPAATNPGQLAAGLLMERVFWFVDVVQFGSAAALLILLVIQLIAFRRPGRGLSNVVRTLAILVAVASLGWRASTIAPGMNAELRAYWNAAQSVETAAEARAHQAAFDVDHPKAARWFNITFASLLLAIVASAVHTVPLVPRPRATDALEPPALATRR
ncbi:MAG: hypothetical protein KDA25_03610 [Phycisphaerales bacterium]|nr:hypothetical protein [Phycisphaerales bacterium]